MRTMMFRTRVQRVAHKFYDVSRWDGGKRSGLMLHVALMDEVKKPIKTGRT